MYLANENLRFVNRKHLLKFSDLVWNERNDSLLPIILYFGSIPILLIIFYMMKFFKKLKSRQSTNGIEIGLDEKSERKLTSERKKSFSLLRWLRIWRLYQNHQTNVYKPSKQEQINGVGLVRKKSSSNASSTLECIDVATRIVEQNDLNGTKRAIEFTDDNDKDDHSNQKGNIEYFDSIFSKEIFACAERINPIYAGYQKEQSSKVDQGDSDEEDGICQKSRTQPSKSISSESGSLTRMIITKIEMHRNQINLDLEKYSDENQSLIENTNDSGEILTENESKTSTNLIRKNSSLSRTKICEQEIDKRLNVPINYLETFDSIDDDHGNKIVGSDQISNEPIYDVPTSRSLIDLVKISDLHLPIKQQRTTTDINYYHTSSPNLLAVKKSNERKIPKLKKENSLFIDDESDADNNSETTHTKSIDHRTTSDDLHRENGNTKRDLQQKQDDDDVEDEDAESIYSTPKSRSLII